MMNGSVGIQFNTECMNEKTFHFYKILAILYSFQVTVVQTIITYTHSQERNQRQVSLQASVKK